MVHKISKFKDKKTISTRMMKAKNIYKDEASVSLETFVD
jgi:hypothetical protein